MVELQRRDMGADAFLGCMGCWVASPVLSTLLLTYSNRICNGQFAQRKYLTIRKTRFKTYKQSKDTESSYRQLNVSYYRSYYNVGKNNNVALYVPP